MREMGMRICKIFITVLLRKTVLVTLMKAALIQKIRE